MKTCTKCQLPKPATTEYFRPHPQRRDGLSSVCRDCNGRTKGYDPIDIKAMAYAKFSNEWMRKIKVSHINGFDEYPPNYSDFISDYIHDR